MWLFYLVIPVGIGLTILGTGPIGIGLAIAGVAGLAIKAAGSFTAQGRTPDEPEPVAGGYKATGPAHEGQNHMTP